MAKKKYSLRYLPLFYEELDRDVSYIATQLGNLNAANNLLDEVESAILKRIEDGPESFEQVPSKKTRPNAYYKIYVKNYIIYYVILEENGSKIMEVRRFLHVLENRYDKV